MSGMLKLAFLNLLRNKRRNILLSLFIAVCVMSLSLFLGYSSYSREGMRLGAISSTGHINIASKNYWNDLADSNNNTTMDEKKVAQVFEAMKKLSSQAWRANRVLEFNGIIGTEHKSTIFAAAALEDLDGIRQALEIDGSAVYSDDSGYIMLGKGLANIIGAEVGEALQISMNTPYGLALYTQEVSGIVQLPDANANKMILFTNLANAWELLGDQGRVHKLQIFITDSKLEEQLMRELMDLIEQEFPELEARDWQTLNPQFTSVMGMYNAVLYFLLLNFLVFVFISILQTVLTISFERTKEFGTLRALGISKDKLVLMVVYEMLVLSALATVLGVILMYATKYSIVSRGITFTPPDSTMAFPIDFYFQPMEILTVAILPIMLAVILACIYPLARIANMEVRKVLEG